jgi:hypothetical protein
MPQFGETYRLSFDGGPFGAGYRYLIVMNVGRSWITLIDPALLKTGKIHISQWSAYRPALQPVSIRKAAIRVEKRMKLYRKLGLHFPKAVRPFVKRLRAAQ